MKKKALVDVKVVCEPPSYLYRGWHSIEDNAKAMEKWASEFNAFVNDHRSQDDVNLSVERIYEDQCEYCLYHWEVDENGCPVCCQKAMDEWEEHEKTKTAQM